MTSTYSHQQHRAKFEPCKVRTPYITFYMYSPRKKKQKKFCDGGNHQTQLPTEIQTTTLVIAASMQAKTSTIYQSNHNTSLKWYTEEILKAATKKK